MTTESAVTITKRFTCSIRQAIVNLPSTFLHLTKLELLIAWGMVLERHNQILMSRLGIPWVSAP